jgi:hypothetical protein
MRGRAEFSPACLLKFCIWHIKSHQTAMILPQKTGDQVKPLFISGGSISEVNNNYPKVEYSEAGILHDTKNILH